MVPSSVKSLFILFLLISVHKLPSQVITLDNIHATTQKKFDKANQWVKEKSFDKALKQYDKIIAGNPGFIDVYIAKGTLLQKMGNKPEAILQYEKAISLKPEYLPRLHYTIGLLEMNADEYDKAFAKFQDYLEYDQTSKRASAAREYLEICSFRADALRHPVPFDPQRLSDVINSPYSEFLPTFTANDIMIFSRNVNNQEDLYYSVQKQGTWEKPVPISSINTPENEAAHTISANGEWLIYTICNRPESLGSCDLMICRKKGDKWSAPQNIGQPINTRGWEAQPTLSADGQTLIFASNRGGGYGDYDLWISRRIKGQWSPPQNLGPQINTPGKDETPFLHADGKTLYFSSDGHAGMGDADLFMSRYQDSFWTDPVNLGYPINTKNHEGAMSVTLDGMTAYYATDRNSNTQGIPNLDLFTFTLPENVRANSMTYVQISIYDADTREPLAGNISIINLEDQSSHQLNTSIEEPIIHLLPMGTDYALHASAQGYTLFTDHFDLDSVNTKQDPYILSIGLHKIQEELDLVAEPIILKNIFFETASATLLPSSNAELAYLYDFLTLNPSISIEIHGHTDNTGTPEFNQELSVDRARAVYQYLIDRGINVNRLKIKGFGSSQPIDSNQTASGRQNNRRTEFIIQK